MFMHVDATPVYETEKVVFCSANFRNKECLVVGDAVSRYQGWCEGA
jgi:hypothetical protein